MQQYEQLKTRLDKLEKNEHVKRRVNAEAAETNASGMETTAATIYDAIICIDIVL